jgi:type VI secretion system Hcp family effector
MLVFADSGGKKRKFAPLIEIRRSPMPIYLRFSSTSRAFGRGKGKLHRLTYGSKVITPRNLSLSLLQIDSESSGSSGQSREGRHHHPIVIVKEVDSASPLLWQALCTNEVLNSADLSFVRPGSTGGGKEQVVERITLTNAFISNIKRYTPSLQGEGSKRDTDQLEEISFVFQKIAYINVSGRKSAKDDWTG